MSLSRFNATRLNTFTSVKMHVTASMLLVVKSEEFINKFCSPPPSYWPVHINVAYRPTLHTHQTARAQRPPHVKHCTAASSATRTSVSRSVPPIDARLDGRRDTAGQTLHRRYSGMVMRRCVTEHRSGRVSGNILPLSPTHPIHAPFRKRPNCPRQT
jgi:hypothetical protein